MIWFACKQCGKRHGKADSLAGSLVFCECGQGNRVPWQSTAPEPEPSAVPPEGAPRPRPWQPPADDDLPLPPARRAWDGHRHNPAYCINHPDAAKEAACDDCRVSLCAACVVRLQGKTLCGPCKNFRVRSLARPSRVSGLAVAALTVSLVSGPVVFFLTMIAVAVSMLGRPAAGTVLLCLLGLALAACGLVLGWLALRQVETRPGVGGRSLAAGGAAAGLAATVWAATVVAILIAKQAQG
jgi:hypothetical protein